MVTRLLAVLVLAAFFGGCGLTDEPPEEPPPPAVPPREGVMIAAAYLASENFIMLWNLHFVGQPAGYKELQTTCPLGGTVHFKGLTTVSQLADGGTSSGTDMYYGLAGCGVSGGKGTLTYTTPSTEPVEGTSIHAKGNWVSRNGVITSKNETLSGVADITGNVRVGGHDMPVDEPACTFSISSSLSGGTWTFSGVMCGIQFNHRIAD